MVRFLLSKIPSILLVLAATSVIAFLLPRFAPGDPAQTIAGPEATPVQVEAIRATLGLDQPLIAQYFTWLGGLFRGELGVSYIFNRSVAELIGSRLESTVSLALLAAVFMIIIGLALGILGGSSQSRASRIAADAVNTLLIATPAFLVGLLLIVLFGVTWRLLPVSGEVPLTENFGIGIQYLLLPALALGLAMAPGIARLLQTTMLTTRGEEFVDLARAKGASPRRITYRHVLRTSLGAAVVAIGLRIGELFGGAIIIEAIFARSGLGQLAVQAVNSRDYQLVQVLVMGAVLIAVVSQLVTEVILAALDPRVRLDA
ncbi:ABC transporter permease [Microbacterium oryzae]|uniref:ABC transporter permease n=1 Tax=Microbacterium oryzae TaxID=743009 RepID=UPI0025B253DC|nr:ABC transporter permease [Microbacterium oryzae]MDN3311596.1 ABC transporter permease [Microbacterium oryzae]